MVGGLGVCVWLRAPETRRKGRGVQEPRASQKSVVRRSMSMKLYRHTRGGRMNMMKRKVHAKRRGQLLAEHDGAIVVLALG